MVIVRDGARFGLGSQSGENPAEPRVGILTAASWFGAYGLIWAAKWTLAICLSDHPGETAIGIVNEVGFRMGGLEPGSRMLPLPLLPTIEMIGAALASVGTIMVDRGPARHPCP